MRQQKALYSPLVSFVHSRCQLPSDPVRFKEAACVDSVGGLATAVKAHRPAVIHGHVPTHLLDDLLPRIRELCGHREVMVRLSDASADNEKGAMFGNPNWTAPYAKARQCVVADVIDGLLNKPGADEELRYLAAVPLKSMLPELSEYLHPLQESVDELTAPRLSTPFGPAVEDSPIIYVGASVQRTPLHFDPTENLTVVLQGSKLFRLFSPLVSRHLQPRGGWLSAANCWLNRTLPAVFADLDVYGDLENDRAKELRPIDVVLQPGEMLYLPSGWWHAVSGSSEPNCTVVFGFEPGGCRR